MPDLFDADPATTTTLNMRAEQRRHRRNHRRIRLVVVSVVALIALAFMANASYSFLLSLQPEETEAADYEGAGTGAVEIVIEEGSSGADIAATLYAADVVASEEAMLEALALNPDSQSIQPGWYTLPRQMRAEYAVEALLDSSYRRVVRYTIPEGLYATAIYARIANVTDYTEEQIADVAENSGDSWGLPEQAGGNPEGWLFPDTYTFDPDATIEDILHTMVDRTTEILTANNVAEEDWQEILTVASLVEREARLDEDRPIIAGVIYNRLEMDMPLQIDASIQYVVRNDNLELTAEELDIDSPYNLRLNTGLPPTPIAASGEASIVAAVNPTESDYLFWVTVNPDTGETKYAVTNAEHEENVAEYQAWLAENS